MFVLRKAVLRDPNPIAGGQGDFARLINLEMSRPVHRQQSNLAICAFDCEATPIPGFHHHAFTTPEAGTF
jgi:hypothetical protein